MGAIPTTFLRKRRRQLPLDPKGHSGRLILWGERTPHLDPNARAALVGLTASHTRGHVVRAVMEGVAYSLKDTFTIFRGDGDSRDVDSAGWRRGEIATVAADSGRRLRATR